MYVINPFSKNPIFQVNQHIGFDKDVLDENGVVVESGDGQGIDGRIFSNEFFEADANSPDLITTYVNTMGGNVQQSLDMLNAISKAKSRTKGIISGFALSCGGWIPLGADIVEMEEHAIWMCHLPYDPANPDDKSEFLDSVANMVATIISNKSGRNGKPKKTKEDILSLMKETTYMDAERMLNEGLIDRVINGTKIVHYDSENKFKPSKKDYKITQIAFNKLITKSTKMKYTNIVNRLKTVKVCPVNLVDDSDEDDVIKAIAKLDNKLIALNEEVVDGAKHEKLLNESQEELKARLKEKESAAEKLKNEADEAMNAFKKMKDAYDMIEADNKIFKAEKDAAILAGKKEKAKTLVNRLVEQGKIIAPAGRKIEEVKDYYEKRATENYEDVEMEFDSKPVRMNFPKPAAKKEVVNVVDNEEDSAISKMNIVNKQRLKDTRKVIPA